jgi:uracil phosphoribosyltransferase
MVKNLLVLEHPIISHHLSVIRQKDTDNFNFRNSAYKIADFLLFEATKNIPLVEVEIETPLVKTKQKIIDNKKEIFIVSILRAGLLISERAAQIIPTARIQHIGMYRDEKTAKPIWYYNKLPENFKNPIDTLVYICDPMLATGNTALESIKLYIGKGIKQENITFISLISAPDGVEKIHKEFPNIKIITAALDEKLNEQYYIVPGLGDAGDRGFNTNY